MQSFGRGNPAFFRLFENIFTPCPAIFPVTGTGTDTAYFQGFLIRANSAPSRKARRLLIISNGGKMNEADKKKWTSIAIAAGMLYAVYKFAPGNAAKAMALGAAGVIAARQVPYLREVV